MQQGAVLIILPLVHSPDDHHRAEVGWQTTHFSNYEVRKAGAEPSRVTPVVFRRLHKRLVQRPDTGHPTPTNRAPCRTTSSIKTDVLPRWSGRPRSCAAIATNLRGRAIYLGPSGVSVGSTASIGMLRNGESMLRLDCDDGNELPSQRSTEHMNFKRGH